MHDRWSASLEMQSSRWIYRWFAAMALSVLLGGCASWRSSPARPSEWQGVPASFAAALTRGLPVAVGVYGMLPSSLDAPASGSDDTGSLPRGGSSDDRLPWSDRDVRVRIGGGFFISADGLIATAAHVVADVPQILVKLSDRRVLRAEFIAADEDMDIALIRVTATLPAAPPLGIGATMRPGDWVVAVGEPYGLDRSAVAGIVGGRHRHFAEDGELLFVQSDLSLNPGNSGGPLLDMRGDIVGMNLRTVVGPYGSPGLSLSVPIEIVRQIAEELVSKGRVKRLRLGAGFEDVSPFAAVAAGRVYASGALINSVETDGLAARMGVRVRDIVVGINGRAIGDSADMARALLGWRSTDGTTVTVYREGRYQQLGLGRRGADGRGVVP
jgi:serine protease Do